jgi:hypothetical protein
MAGKIEEKSIPNGKASLERNVPVTYPNSEPNSDEGNGDHMIVEENHGNTDDVVIVNSGGKLTVKLVEKSKKISISTPAVPSVGGNRLLLKDVSAADEERLLKIYRLFPAA